MLNGEQKAGFLGFATGVLLTIAICVLVANEVEKSKVANGYLTFKRIVYEVTLYDTLDTPGNEVWKGFEAVE